MALTLHGTVTDNQAGILRPRKNITPLYMNGDMAVAQRGTSFASLSSGANQTLDRHGFVVNEGTFTVTQDSDVPTGQGFGKSLKVDCTSADTSISSDGVVQVYQRFEGQNLQLLKKGTSSAEYVTIAFWVKSNLAGNFTLEVKDQDNSRLIASQVTISSADTWEKKVVAFPGDTTGALTNDNNLSLQVTWWLVAGSDYNSGTLATSWEAQNNANRAVGNFNLASSTDNEFYLTGVQMEVGQFDADSIPAFQFEDRATNLARCQRYFERITTSGSGDSFGAGVCFSATQGRVDIRYSTVKRANPTITFGSASDFLLQAGNKSQAPTGLSSAGSSLHGFFCHTTNSGFTVGHGCVLLDNSTADATIDASSDL